MEHSPINIGPNAIYILINLVFLYWFCKKFLFGPVTAFMEKRAKGIQDQLDQAKNKMLEAEDANAQYLEQLKSASSKAEEILKTAREDAGKEYDQLINKARKDAEQIMVKANQAIEIETEKAMREMKNQITSLAFAAASKIIQKNVDNEANREIVEKLLKEEGVA